MNKKRINFDPNLTFFTSDLHFNHKNILKFTNRPFNSIDEMDDGLINNWNSVVPKNGITFILGDFFFGKSNSKKMKEILNELNGLKYLILGNHDYFDKDIYIDCGFQSVSEYSEIMIENNQLIIMSHYPMLTWNRINYGSWMFHGHVHGRFNYLIKNLKELHQENEFVGINLIDVGIDNPDCNFSPFSFFQIKEKVTKINESTKI